MSDICQGLATCGNCSKCLSHIELTALRRKCELMKKLVYSLSNVLHNIECRGIELTTKEDKTWEEVTLKLEALRSVRGKEGK